MLAPTARKPLPRLPLCTTSGPRTAHSATPQQAGHPSRRRCSPAPTRREGAGAPYWGYWQVPAPPRSLLLLELHGHLLQRRLPQLLLVAHERLGFNGTGRMHVAAAGGNLVLHLRSDQHRAQVIGVAPGRLAAAEPIDRLLPRSREEAQAISRKEHPALL